MKTAKIFGIILVSALFLSACSQLGSTQAGEKPSQKEEVNTNSSVDGDKNTETENNIETETETQKEPVVSTFTLTATGDCALGVLQYHEYAGSFHQYYSEQGSSYFFSNFKDVFENDDMTLINLECVFTDETERVEKKFNIKGQPEYTGILTSSSVEVCTMGNNHSMDYGPESLIDTQNALDEAGVLWAYNDVVSYYTTADGIKVAVVSVSTLSDMTQAEAYFFDGIAKAKEQGANLIVVCPHWGIEGTNYANETQTSLAHRFIDAGADLVVGNHPHVLQGVEYYKGKLICYSLGNFSFGANRNPARKDTAVFQQTFTFVDGVLQPEVDAKIIPARVSGASDYNNYQPIVAQGEQMKSIIEQMKTYSSAYEGVTFDDNGKIIVQ